MRPEAEAARAPPVDIYETDEAFVLKAELPGFSKDGVLELRLPKSPAAQPKRISIAEAQEPAGTAAEKASAGR